MRRAKGTDLLYVAAERFVDAALRRDDSMFTPGAVIWSAQHLKDLSARFLGQPDVGDRAFEEKLQLPRSTVATTPASTCRRSPCP